MAELANCSRCNAVFVKTVRDICQSCYKEEEKAFQTVYRFLSVRENREATMQEIVKATGIEEYLIIKFIREKRLLTSKFPKLAYPCERCGVDIVTGKYCSNCTDELKRDLEIHERNEKRAEQNKDRKNIYYTFEKHNK
ncbi:TIGR03826 family flagellar region protein [Virgibacillus doumboii]|uniref:TIGR03826 family flagellar region protein n=1 Tax=Virgibacillus doumboii TaxID=2697503 RepID=UPI0013DF31C7|nr:TIGR03826 family flagellar region protein [Virgibacillus doumboii]